MSRINIRSKAPQEFTHEGAPAARINPVQRLRRLVMSCMLWEGEFYVDGKMIADQITDAASKVSASQLAAIAIEARNTAQLRHVPLLLIDILTQRFSDMAGVVAQVLQRSDEPGELIAINLKRRGILNVNKAKTLPASIRKGIELALQFGRDFGEYGLAKYDRDDAVKIKDVLRLVHPKPLSAAQDQLWKRAVKGELKAPDTWEVALSHGADKKEVFERLLREQRLGYLALLRNLRNMENADVDRELIQEALVARRGAARVLPFRYIAAARAAPSLDYWINEALLSSILETPKLKGRTFVLVDVSGSMGNKLSEKSDLTRMDAAAALASVVNGDDVRVWTFSMTLTQVPPRRGLAGVDAVIKSQQHMGTYLGQSLERLNGEMRLEDRLIVVTDEQSADPVGLPVPKKAYMINVASDRNGVGYGPHWVHFDGFSEAVLRFIVEHEREDSDGS